MKKFMSLALVAIVAGVVLTGCSGSTEGDANATTPAANAATNTDASTNAAANNAATE